MIDIVMIWRAILKAEWSTLIGSFTVNITQYALITGPGAWQNKTLKLWKSRCCNGDNFLNTSSLAVLLIERQTLVLTVLFLPPPPLKLWRDKYSQFCKAEDWTLRHFDPVYGPFYFTVRFVTERKSVTSYSYCSKISGSPQFLENYGLPFYSWVQWYTRVIHGIFFCHICMAWIQKCFYLGNIATWRNDFSSLYFKVPSPSLFSWSLSGTFGFWSCSKKYSAPTRSDILRNPIRLPGKQFRDCPITCLLSCDLLIAALRASGNDASTAGIWGTIVASSSYDRLCFILLRSILTPFLVSGGRLSNSGRIEAKRSSKLILVEIAFSWVTFVCW